MTTHALRPALVDAAPMRAGFFDRPARKPRACRRLDRGARGARPRAREPGRVGEARVAFRPRVRERRSRGGRDERPPPPPRPRRRPETFARLAKSLNLPRTACVALAGTRALPFDLPGREWFPREDPITAEPIDWRLDADRRQRPTPSSRARRVADLVDALAPRFPSERVHVFGFADGGVVALEVAASLRDAIRTVGGAPPPPARRDSRAPHRGFVGFAFGSNPPPVSPRASRGVSVVVPGHDRRGEGDRAAAEATAAALGDDADVRVEPPGEGGASSPREAARCPRGRRGA